MSNQYRQQYLSTVTTFFNGRTQYDNETTIGRALPLLDLVPLTAGQHVLDMATGTGIVAIAAAKKVGSNGLGCRCRYLGRNAGAGSEKDYGVRSIVY